MNHSVLISVACATKIFLPKLNYTAPYEAVLKKKQVCNQQCGSVCCVLFKLILKSTGLIFSNPHMKYASNLKILFSSEEDFFKWKEEMKHETHSKFIKMCGAKILGDISKHYYVCHRSGEFISEGEGIRHLKIMGSNKINGKCPWEMKVTVCNTGTCRVHFVSTHVGHELELEHLQLTQKERESIAADIALQIPFRDILDKIRRTVRDSKLERVHVNVMQDLHNIGGSWNVSSKSSRHQNDAITVEAWVQEVKESDNPCILFYKPQETTNELHPELRSDDFVLVIINSAQSEILKYGTDCICLDGTHGLNGYDFEVTTLLVLDELRQGFQCAFIISNRNDSDVLTIFFQYVRSQAGQICPKVFMSDLAESYSIAWNITMGTPTMRLYCTWHVDRAWRSNIKSKIQCADKRKEVYKLLRSLMQVRDVAVFEESLPKAMQILSSDPEFVSYFKTYYMKNVKSWAYCHMLHAGLNTGMHKSLKYTHGGAKQVKRLDSGISALISLDSQTV